MARMLDLVPTYGITWRPGMRLLDRFFDEWFSPSYSMEGCEWNPPSDIAETDKAYVLTAELPGVDPKNVDISFDDGIVTIKGSKDKEMAEGESCYCAERYSGSFQRSFRIPGKVDKDKIDATFQHGVLKLTLPKSEESVPKKIEIH
jgi:HSP20 family protein